MQQIPAHLKEQLSNLGITTRTVIGFNNVKCEVPRHINMIPHGWQVRFARTNEPYFSRSFANVKHGGSCNALNLAILCLISQQAKYKPNDHLYNGCENGVKISFSRKKINQNQIPSFTATVTLLHQREGALVVLGRHLGTQNTITQQRVDSVVKELLGAWFWAKEMKQKIGRNAFAKLSGEIPENTSTFLPKDFSVPSYRIDDILNQLARP